MKNFWKFLLLFLGVFVLAFCVALPLFGFGLFGGTGMFGMRRGFDGFGGFYGMPMMGRGFGAFGIGFALLRLIVPLGLLALVVVGVVWLVRRPSSPRMITTAPAGVQPTASALVETQPCPNCGRQVEKGWVACPYCGHHLEETPPPPAPPTEGPK